MSSWGGGVKGKALGKGKGSAGTRSPTSTRTTFLTQFVLYFVPSVPTARQRSHSLRAKAAQLGREWRMPWVEASFMMEDTLEAVRSLGGGAAMR